MLPTILQYDFMIRALIAGGIVGVIAPMIGMFLVVRRYSLMADTLSHVSLAGVAIGLFAGLNPLATALVVAIVGAIAIERLREARSIGGESVLALFLSGSLAIALVLISLARGFTVNLFSYLFGSITTVTTGDIQTMAFLGVMVAALILILYKELFFVSFDEEAARANGLRVNALNIILMLLAAIVVSLTMRVVGVMLTGALMVIPVISAMQLGMSFKRTMIASILFSELAVVSGLIISYYFDLSSGGTIVLVALGVFLMCVLVNRGNR